MKRILPILLALLLSSPLYGEVVERIVAVVNGEIITLSELKTATSAFLAQLEGKRLDHDGSIERQILKALIEEKLVEQAAQRMGIAPTEREVDRAIKDLMEKNGLDEETFRRLLRKNGVEYGEFRRKVRRDLTQVRFIERVINPRITVREEEVKAYYRKHRKDFSRPLEVRLRDIFIPFPDNSFLGKEKARSLAMDIYERLKKGEDFASLAREFSKGPGRKEGGDIGYVKKGELDPAIEEVAFKLKPGEISRPVETDEGIHILQALEQRGGVRPFEEVKEEIRAILFQKKGERLYREWIEDMKKRSYIEVRF